MTRVTIDGPVCVRRRAVAHTTGPWFSYGDATCQALPSRLDFSGTRQAHAPSRCWGCCPRRLELEDARWFPCGTVTAYCDHFACFLKYYRGPVNMWLLLQEKRAVAVILNIIWWHTASSEEFLFYTSGTVHVVFFILTSITRVPPPCTCPCLSERTMVRGVLAMAAA